ncbi:MAG: hypothetical protein KatS3mg105_4060 [Gemmatales bacterium]|nr:MAG: hypothetical protein KatS3mg105_4060 [Gemmatales bacterium]
MFSVPELMPISITAAQGVRLTVEIIGIDGQT